MMDTFLVREEEPSEHKEKPSETLRFQGCVVDLSQLYSNQNTYLKINKSKAKSSSIPDTSVKLREAEKCSVNEHGETEVKKICQKQRILSKKEREKIKEQYMQGVSTEELAKSFGCHRVTISKALRKAGVTPTIEKLDINDAILSDTLSKLISLLRTTLSLSMVEQARHVLPVEASTYGSEV